jgi:hypothetical protein
MQPEIEKPRPRRSAPPETPGPEARKDEGFTARMHFYAVHNVGEQLRRSKHSRTGKKPDRMVGR